MKEGACILVVDDHPVVLESLAATLEMEGYQVRTAHDGVEALAVLGSEAVDLILADISMPRMNGYQLLERVRAHPAWVMIPIVFLTARALDSDVRYGIELGVDGYLTKPVEPEDVLAVVRGKLLRARQLAEAMASSGAPIGGQRTLLPSAGWTAGLTEPIKLGTIRVEPGQHRTWVGQKLVRLSAREFSVLELLARRAGQVIGPEELIRASHGLDLDRVEAGALLRPLVRSLRRKLGYPVGEMGCIETVRGVGYLLSPGPEPTS